MTNLHDLNKAAGMSFILRDYQNQAKADIYQAWNDGHQNVLLVLPTGAGKTVSFSSVAYDMVHALVEINGRKIKYPTAIIVHRKELVQQISLTLAQAGIVHNIIAPRNVIKGIIAAQRKVLNKQFYDHTAAVSVISVDTLNARFDRYKDWAKLIRLWITDEAAHVTKNNKWGRAVDYFPNAIGLGVTATPQRLDKRGLGRHADGVFDVMVEGPSVRLLIDRGFLCSYRAAIPESDYRLHLKETTGDSDYSKEAMLVAAQHSHIVGDTVANYKKFANGKQAIIFCDSIETATKMETKFLNDQIKAKLLTGETDDNERLQALIDYRDRKTQVLLNVDLFDEGLDVPGIECVIMARPTKSLGKYLQMIGRGLRPAKGKPFLILIDQVGNIKEHGLPDMRRTWSLDRVTRRRDKINLIRICKNYECNAPFDRVLTTCPYCGTEDKRSPPGEGGGRPSVQMVDGDLVLLDPETLRQMETKAQLEDPGVVARRVGKVAGKYAAEKAAKDQMERIETQKKLAHMIAVWAGMIRREGWADRTIHKMFYQLFERTITEALAEPKAHMLRVLEELENETRRYRFARDSARISKA